MIGKRREYRLYREPASRTRRFGLVVAFVIIVLLIYLIVTGFLLRSVAAGSSSMEPTIIPGDRMLVTPLAYGPVVPFTNAKIRPITSPRRGDLVLVRPPYYRSTKLIDLVNPIVGFFTLQNVRLHPGPEVTEQIELIRRVVGLPGDTIRVENFVASVRPVDATVFTLEFDLSRRSYATTFDPLPNGWDASLPFSGTPKEYELGENEYFVLSDNRSYTNDSRYWGPVGIESLTGRVLMRYWPFSEFGVLR